MTTITPLSAAGYRRVAWKNGGGTTTDIAFDGDIWRFSRTPITRPGPFSDYAGFDRLQMLIAGHGLTCQSAHFSLEELRKDQATSIAWAKDVGITQMFVAYLGSSHPTMDDVKRAAEE